MTRLEYTKSKICKECIDEALFEKAIEKCTGREKGVKGIGTLSEKTTHAVLKYYYVPDESCHEIKVLKEESIQKYLSAGKKVRKKPRDFVADACIDGEIYEIQSGSFYTMRDKLSLFLNEHDVTIVYPVAFTKYIRYVDKETGEISEAKKSPARGTVYDILPELYGIKSFLGNKRIHFIISFIEMEEYKLLDGFGKKRKIKATKTDRIPLKILGEMRIDKKKDFLNFLPGYKDGKREKDCPLPREFTNKDLAELTGFHLSYAEYLTNILSGLHLIKNIGYNGRYKLYSI